MKIAHLIWGLNVGGSETMLVDIANAQAEAHNVWVIVGNCDVDPSIMSSFERRVHVDLLGRLPGSRNPWFVAIMLAKVWGIRPDVIHVHQESFIRLKRLMPAPLILTIHDTRHALSHTLIRYDSVCCISEAVKNDVKQRFPFLNPKVVHNGVKFSSITAKARYGQNPFRVVQISRLEHRKKGQDLLIRALKRVSDIMGEGNITVDFIGEGSSREFLQNLAVECKVEKYCRFLGAKTRQYIYDSLCHYDLLAQPSRYEGFGLTIIEGIAAGLPVLVSDIEGPLEIVDNGRLGDSFRSNDYSDCADKIIRLVEKSGQTDFDSQMKERRDRARRRFDISLTAKNYIDIYREVLAEKSASHQSSAAIG